MSASERRSEQAGDRRAVPRGGRRPYDRPGRFPNLLVADSYEGARVPCVRYLDHFGFRVEQAADGNQALSILSTLQPHVVLAELTLRAVSATGICDWLDQEPGTRLVPVIVLQSDFDTNQVVELPGRATAVLVKPFPLSTMLQQVRRALRAHPPAPC
jgi:two-component system phosphate regulon response regulator PhoB